MPKQASLTNFFTKSPKNTKKLVSTSDISPLVDKENVPPAEPSPLKRSSQEENPKSEPKKPKAQETPVVVILEDDMTDSGSQEKEAELPKILVKESKSEAQPGPKITVSETPLESKLLTTGNETQKRKSKSPVRSRSVSPKPALLNLEDLNRRKQEIEARKEAAKTKNLTKKEEQKLQGNENRLKNDFERYHKQQVKLEEQRIRKEKKEADDLARKLKKEKEELEKKLRAEQREKDKKERDEKKKRDDEEKKLKAEQREKEKKDRAEAKAAEKAEKDRLKAEKDKAEAEKKEAKEAEQKRKDAILAEKKAKEEEENRLKEAEQKKLQAKKEKEAKRFAGFFKKIEKKDGITAVNGSNDTAHNTTNNDSGHDEILEITPFTFSFMNRKFNLPKSCVYSEEVSKLIGQVSDDSGIVQQRGCEMRGIVDRKMCFKNEL